MEREIQTLKELLAQIISPEAKGDPNLALVEVVFHINFRSFGDKVFSPAYKHWACLPWDIPATGEVEKLYIPHNGNSQPLNGPRVRMLASFHRVPPLQYRCPPDIRPGTDQETLPKEEATDRCHNFCDFLYLYTVVCSAFCGGFVGPCPTTPYSFAHED